MPYYLIDDNKNKVEVTNIENNLFRTVLAKIHSEVNNNDYAIEFVTQAQFNQLEADDELQPNTYYFITDDTTLDDIEAHIDEEVGQLKSDLQDGSVVVKEATNATNADYATNAQNAEEAEKATTTNFTNSNLRTKDLTESSDFLIYSLGYYHFYYEQIAETIDLGVINLKVGEYIKKSAICVSTSTNRATFYSIIFHVSTYGVNYNVTTWIYKKEETSSGAYPSGEWTELTDTSNAGTLKYKLIK